MSLPVGRTVTNNKVSYEIIGMVADAKYSGLKEPAPRTVYIPWTQRTGEELTDFNFLTRVSGGDPMRIAGTVEALVRQVDPALRVDTAAAWSTVVDRTIATARMMAGLGGFFGLLALTSRLSILKMVLGESMATVALGCIVGAVGALGIGRLTQALLYDVSPADPKAFGMAALALLFSGLLAGWLPARRAARIDPMVALRYD